MKIKYLPQEIKGLALQNQFNSLGYTDEECDLFDAFPFGESKEGFVFWDSANLGKILKNVYGKIEEQKPNQYNIGIDTFERAKANLTKEELLASCRFNIDKYTWRKKEQDKSDFEKIIAYAKYALENGF